MWEGYDFSVSTGKGGGVFTAGPIVLAIRDTVFRANEASKGASLSVTAAARVSASWAAHFQNIRLEGKECLFERLPTYLSTVTYAYLS